MNKLNSLRKHLLSLAHLKLQADNLHTFVEDQGKVISYQNQATNTGFGSDLAEGKPKTNQNFKLEYQASIIVTEYAHDFNVLAFEVIQWLDKSEHNRGAEAFNYKADLLSSTAYDVELTLALTELITVTEKDGGILIDGHQCDRVQL